MADDEEVTHSRVLTIEHNMDNISKAVVALDKSIGDEREENKVFRDAIMDKLDSKSDFNLVSSVKTASVTVLLFGSIWAVIDYTIDSKISGVKVNDDHRDEKIETVIKGIETSLGAISRLQIEVSNLKKNVQGNNDFVSHFQYDEKFPIQMNTLTINQDSMMQKLSDLERRFYGKSTKY